MPVGVGPMRGARSSPTTAVEKVKQWLQNPSPESFPGFCELYEPVIRQWAEQFLRARSESLPVDIDDLAHDAVIFLWDICFCQSKYDLAKRVHKGGFRKWMRTSAEHAWEGSVRRWRTDRGRGGEGGLIVLESREAVTGCADAVDVELRRDIFAEVLAELEPELDEVDRHILNVLGLGHGNTNPVDGSERPRAGEMARKFGIDADALYKRKASLRKKVKQRAKQKFALLTAIIEADHVRPVSPGSIG